MIGRIGCPLHILRRNLDQFCRRANCPTSWSVWTARVSPCVYTTGWGPVLRLALQNSCLRLPELGCPLAYIQRIGGRFWCSGGPTKLRACPGRPGCSLVQYPRRPFYCSVVIHTTHWGPVLILARTYKVCSLGGPSDLATSTPSEGSRLLPATENIWASTYTTSRGSILMLLPGRFRQSPLYQRVRPLFWYPSFWELAETRRRHHLYIQ